MESLQTSYEVSTGTRLGPSGLQGPSQALGVHGAAVGPVTKSTASQATTWEAFSCAPGTERGPVVFRDPPLQGGGSRLGGQHHASCSARCPPPWLGSASRAWTMASASPPLDEARWWCAPFALPTSRCPGPGSPAVAASRAGRLPHNHCWHPLRRLGHILSKSGVAQQGRKRPQTSQQLQEAACISLRGACAL